jgi:hypothetical protein
MSKKKLKRIMKLYKDGVLTSYYVFKAFEDYYKEKGIIIPANVKPTQQPDR